MNRVLSSSRRWSLLPLVVALPLGLAGCGTNGEPSVTVEQGQPAPSVAPAADVLPHVRDDGRFVVTSVPSGLVSQGVTEETLDPEGKVARVTETYGAKAEFKDLPEMREFRDHPALNINTVRGQDADRMASRLGRPGPHSHAARAPTPTPGLQAASRGLP